MGRQTWICAQSQSADLVGRPGLRSIATPEGARPPTCWSWPTTPGDWMLQCHVLDHTVNPDDAGGDGSATAMADIGGLITYLHDKPTT